MADTKVSALVSAAVVNIADYFLLVQAGSSLKLPVDVFCLNMPSRIKIIEASEALVAAGAIATNKLVTKLTLGAAIAYTLAAGTHGMEKQIVASASTGTANVTVTSGTGVTTIAFNAVGDSVHLKNIDGSWYVLGSNSVTIS